VSASVVLEKPALDRVIGNLRAAGLRVIGPTVRDSAIVLEEIEHLDELPVGWSDEQGPGKYRAAPGTSGLYFNYNVGAHSWKQFLFPPRQTLLTFRRENGNWKFIPHDERPPRYAFLGVRACDLAAIQVQDRVFLSNEFHDPHYAARRRTAFIVAVNCTCAAATCFCTSMNTGPCASNGFDLALTELSDEFVIEVGSEEGSQMLEGTGWRAAAAYDLGRAAKAVEDTERAIMRQLRTHNLPKLLYEQLDSPKWDSVGQRCLSCGNCTLVCPTCFCSTVEDSSDLSGTTGTRTRVWDSCFNLDFSHVHGGNIRPTTRARYRQWLTHKLASWMGQFGTLGCIGCGRCITWCPVGIDITHEAKNFQEGGSR
jgi:formate hydrogenlyase subunit 6/NADH:ubiquinone oxidoreductase subunit I